MIAKEDLPRKGDLPVNISYKMAPKAYWSDCGVAGSPLHCSGLRYLASMKRARIAVASGPPPTFGMPKSDT